MNSRMEILSILEGGLLFVLLEAGETILHLSILYWKLLLTLTTLFTLWYYIFWKPLDQRKDFTDFGFYDTKKQFPGFGNDATRKRIINEIRKRRKIGDIPPIYPNGWFVILDSKDLPKGGVKEVGCFGLELVAWRGENGDSFVADAYCPHLGAHLGVYGEVSKNCIKCPFHGWTFEGTGGKCVGIPYSKGVPEAQIKIRKTLEMNGFIYMWYHADNEEPNYKPDEILQIASGEWRYRGRSEYRVVCHTQEISENGADLSHLNILHASPVLTGGKPQESFFQYSFLKHTWSGSWEADPVLSHRALMTVNHKMTLFNRWHFMAMTVKAHQVGPGTVFLKYEGFVAKASSSSHSRRWSQC